MTAQTLLYSTLNNPTLLHLSPPEATQTLFMIEIVEP